MDLDLTVISCSVGIIGFMYSIMRNFKNDINGRMDRRLDAFEKRMDVFDAKILSLDERMFWLSTGKSLADAIKEERMKIEAIK